MVLHGVFIVCIFAAGLLGAFMSSYLMTSRLMYMAKQASGGVILSVSLVHLLGDLTQEQSQDFPFACMFVGLGFTLTLAVEELGQGFKRPGHMHSHVAHGLIMWLALSFHSFFAG